MKINEISDYLESLKKRKAVLEERLSSQDIYSNPSELKQVSMEHQQLTQLFTLYENIGKANEELIEAKEILNTENDKELCEMAQADIDMLTKEIGYMESQISCLLLPPDPNDSKNIIIEIRPAAGGEEAALFVGDMFRMYSHYAEQQNWKLDVLDLTGSDLGGIKEVIFSLSGERVYSKMKYESGVHRVQRIPVTESGGRIHTSTVTVAVMPEAEEIDLKIDPEDLRIDVFRASGPGGQCVNTTDSAVRITHIPTGVSVASQQEKSQHRNKEIAMRILRTKLLEQMQREEAQKLAAEKKSQLGTGDRSERIRTYNFPQSRVTDHRFGVSCFDLTGLLNGNLDLILTPILKIANEKKLNEIINNPKK